jgi:hypothetical protein
MDRNNIAISHYTMFHGRTSEACSMHEMIARYVMLGCNNEAQVHAFFCRHLLQVQKDAEQLYPLLAERKNHPQKMVEHTVPFFTNDLASVRQTRAGASMYWRDMVAQSDRKHIYEAIIKRHESLYDPEREYPPYRDEELEALIEHDRLQRKKTMNAWKFWQPETRTVAVQTE